MVELVLAEGWVIPSTDLQFRQSRSSGPGGQNVNKVSTKAELRFFLLESTALTEAQKRRLRLAYPSYVTTRGEFLVVSERTRSLPQNQQDALDKLATMLRAIRRPPKARVATKPSRASKAKRMDGKRRQGEKKRLRGKVE